MVADGGNPRPDRPGVQESLRAAELIGALSLATDLGVGEPRRVTVRHRDQPSLPATPNREFRYLVNQDAGCVDVTQFVGVIPPGRAPEHSHTYDEVVYILEGNGVYHIAGEDFPLEAGTCLHLPPYVRHCLENTGSNNMKVLGVFHPSGDPASKAFEDRVDNKEGM